jgi:cysteinyl-tRNA synthetase
MQAGERIEPDVRKHDARDFALWKSAKPEDEATGAAWDSPWGRGRPGRHLESSAMAMDLLGPTLDIHCGAVDLIFPHHEDEIAQSEAATGKPFSRWWCHGAFLNVEGAKMAKRIGNTTTVLGMREKGVSPAALRHFVFTTHYRKELNLSDEAIEASMNAVRRIGDFADRLGTAASGTPELAAAARAAVDDFKAALFDDLNAPNAMAALFTFVNRANAELDKRGTDAGAVAEAKRAFETMNGVLDILPDREVSDPGLAAWVEERIAARKAARAGRNFAEADRIRSELLEKGIVIEDGPAGTTWKRRD